MSPDDELCLCFHVSRRKVANFIRVEQPRRVGQLSECFGAGTGCGWCRPFLQRMFDDAVRRGTLAADPGTNSAEPLQSIAEISAAEYARRRSAYVRAGGGTPPPGAAPIEPLES